MKIMINLLDGTIFVLRIGISCVFMMVSILAFLSIIGGFIVHSSEKKIKWEDIASWLLLSFIAGLSGAIAWLLWP